MGRQNKDGFELIAVPVYLVEDKLEVYWQSVTVPKLQAHYAGAVPLDQLKSEQDRLALELAGARDVLSTKRFHRDQLERAVMQALELLAKRRAAGSGQDLSPRRPELAAADWGIARGHRLGSV